MKITRLEGSCREEEEENPINGTVIVGVRLDSPSKELLTWALVKVAQPGDRVIALHVLTTHEWLDPDGQSSLISHVKAFESVLSVYEGFCNLRQVNLKLKICRGASVRKVLVREAKSFTPCKVILGVAKTSSPIRSSASIAKYCGWKLGHDCWVLAVNNGKVVFQRKASPSSGGRNDSGHRPTSLFGVIQRTLSKNYRSPNLRLLEYPSSKESKNKKNNKDQENCHSCSANSEFINGFCGISVSNIPLKKKCPICEPFSILPEGTLCHDPPEFTNSSCNQSGEDPAATITNSLALVPVQTLEMSTSSTSQVTRVPRLRIHWPFFRKAICPNPRALENTDRQVSVAEWAMWLPIRHSAAAVHPVHKSVKSGDANVTNLDGESGAMVLVGDSNSATSYEIKKEEPKIVPKELESLHEKFSSTCRLFSYQELLQATSNFSPDHLVGKGGNSKVYKGCLSDGRELAVKILKASEDAIKEFVLEIEIITTLTHKNTISLFGFCFEDNNLLLVYDFLSRGSLEENLHGEKDRHVFSWDERYKVALGIAEALVYLHSRSPQPVIHRDVKSSNILLADDFEPQLSDFGLAKWDSASSNHSTCCDVAGTFGYLAPEYFMYGKVTDKVDVYAFGVVLLELLSGRKPISNEYPKGEESLVMWAKATLRSGKYSLLLDPKLGDAFDNDQMEKMMIAASLCIRQAPRFRPRIDLILKLLQGDEEVTKWANLQVSSLDEFDRLDDESFPRASNIQSHLNVALLDVGEDSFSVSSMESSVGYLTADKSIEDYLQGRWSRSSSFD